MALGKNEIENNFTFLIQITFGTPHDTILRSLVIFCQIASFCWTS